MIHSLRMTEHDPLAQDDGARTTRSWCAVSMNLGILTRNGWTVKTRASQDFKRVQMDFKITLLTNGDFEQTVIVSIGV